VNDTLKTETVGRSVSCTVCGRTKQPVGRDAPLGSCMCGFECPGYRLDPLPGELWPGETREDFGY
jgi:hypothetical protein